MDHERLQQVIRSGDRLVIFLHDNPDPDAIAAGWILQHIGEHLGVEAVIVYGGRLGRAENSVMVKLLDIPLTRDSRSSRAIGSLWWTPSPAPATTRFPTKNTHATS